MPIIQQGTFVSSIFGSQKFHATPEVLDTYSVSFHDGLVLKVFRARETSVFGLCQLVLQNAQSQRNMATIIYEVAGLPKGLRVGSRVCQFHVRCFQQGLEGCPLGVAECCSGAPSLCVPSQRKRPVAMFVTHALFGRYCNGQ